MIRKLFFTSPLLFLFLFCLGQNISENTPKSALTHKPLININTYSKWPSVGSHITISSNGKYVSYRIENLPTSHSTLIIKKIKSNWELEFIDAEEAFFTEDSNNAILKNKGDSLCIINLTTKSIEFIPNISTFVVKSSKKASYVYYQQTTSSQDLAIRNINSKKEIIYSNVEYYWISEEGKDAILLTNILKNKTNTKSLDWISLEKNRTNSIWQGDSVSNVVFNTNNNQIAFNSYSKNENKLIKELCSYDNRTGETAVLIKDESLKDSTLELDDIIRFSKDNSRIFFSTKEKRKRIPPSETVDIWSYTDTILQSEQLNQLDARNFFFVVNIKSNLTIRLEQQFEDVTDLGSRNADNFTVVRKQINRSPGESNWNPTCLPQWYLISTINGDKKALPFATGINSLFISKNGKFLYYWDSKISSFVLYDILKEQIKKLSDRMPTNDIRSWSIEGWSSNDDWIILNDGFDLWKINTSNTKPPTSITNGYGRRNKITLSILYPENISSINDDIIISGFNKETKQNGFYRKKMFMVGDPVRLTMGSYIYYAGYNGNIPYNLNIRPIKAKLAKVYIVKRTSSTESPNYFSTDDFISYFPLTNIHPEKDYNWYNVELHNWKSLTGHALQGILYKPEDFDSTLKYPIIFHYYEEMSDALNAYIEPSPLTNGCTINIPTYASNGYLIFCIDIKYPKNDPMQGTYDAILSAVKYVSNKSYIDTSKMGIQGCSWGGIQTNFIVTQTNVFKAACTAASISDWISAYGSIDSKGQSRQGGYEQGQSRVAATLWDRPDIYIKNSAVLSANKITTPLLIMHGKRDEACPFSNAIELFTALRRLGKKSWLLAYDSFHGVTGKNADDFSIRMQQFFDHYLKGKHAPAWMIYGVPAAQKSFDSGLKLINNNKTPGKGLINVP